MKKVMKWIAIGIAGLLVLAVIFTAVFVVIPLSRSVKNLQEKKDEPTAAVTQAADTATTAAPDAQATTAPAAPEDNTAQLPENMFTEYDVYRSGKFYVKGSVTDSDGETNPMELAITDGSVYMLTAVSDISMGVMIGGGKTYLVSPQHRAYVELSKTVMSVLGMDSSKLSASTNFNFSDMQPLSQADDIVDTELNGIRCREYIFHGSSGRKTSIYMDGTRLLEIDTVNADGSLYNRMAFDSVSAEIPADRIAPPTYYDKKGILGFISLVSKDMS